MPKHVVVVDDDDISRRGIATLLAEDSGIEVLGELTHAQALGANHQWSLADVVIVDAADARREDDHFPGVAVVQAIRSRRSPAETMVIVITGHYFDDAIRRRMREARADFFYHRTELQDGQALRDAVLRPDEARAGVPPISDQEALIRIGVTSTSRVNEGVGFALRGGLESTLQANTGRLGRAWVRQRRDFNACTKLRTVTADGVEPAREQTDPSVPQIQRFLRWATKVK
ncbi:MAG: hypothetical protein ACREOA_09180 [Candidatus Dormibacteria bacterium]